jgi:hypothetical protein
VDPALFLSGDPVDANINPAAACPDGTPPFRFSGHVFNAPLLFNSPILSSEPFWLILFALLALERRTKKPVTAASTGVAEWSFWNPSGNDRRDPNTLAPNRIEARTTPSRPSSNSTSS